MCADYFIQCQGCCRETHWPRGHSEALRRYGFSERYHLDIMTSIETGKLYKRWWKIRIFHRLYSFSVHKIFSTSCPRLGFFIPILVLVCNYISNSEGDQATLKRQYAGFSAETQTNMLINLVLILTVLLYVQVTAPVLSQENGKGTRGFIHPPDTNVVV